MKLKSKILSYLLVLAGLLQMIGYAANLPSIKGLAAAYLVSPLPLVFSHFRDYETFANDFYLEIKTDNGQKRVIQITPEVYSKIKGPYNRRNVYGAAIAYGPKFKKPDEIKLLKQVLKYSFCAESPFLKEINFKDPYQDIKILVYSKTSGVEKRYVLNWECDS